MAGSTALASYWDLVGAIVKRRGRTLKRYRYFERAWASLQDCQLLFLEAPTGAGKTEAVLTPFLQGLVSGERMWHSLLYVLPTRSLVFNMFYRFCKALSACREFFGEIGPVVVDYDYGGFTPFKAFIEGDITLTTYDTLIYTFYGFRSYGHHLLLSVGKIAGALIILDEAQLLQDAHWYSLSLLPHHVANFLAFGATVVVMTATLPQILVEETLNAVKSPYLTTSHNLLKVNPNEDSIERGSLEVSLRSGCLLDEVPALASNCEKPLLLVFNTVERAAAAYQQLAANGYDNLVLLHSRLISGVKRDRETIFEKNGQKRDLIVVATQVVEAGVDYDFKTIATEISPIDSLIQRLGRCARRNDGYAIVYSDPEQAKHVYPQALVDQTLRAIDGDLLAESVRNSLVASDMVNRVYRREIVDQLRKEAAEDLRGALSFIKGFKLSGIFAARPATSPQAASLLRLGIEVRCILLPPQLYSEVVERCTRSTEDKIPLDISIAQFINLLEENTLSLSIERVYPNLEIPALKHPVSNKALYLSLSTAPSSSFQEASEESGEEKVVVVEKHEDLAKAVERRLKGFSAPFIVNPQYYRYLAPSDYHLGLVKPYERLP